LHYLLAEHDSRPALGQTVIQEQVEQGRRAGGPSMAPTVPPIFAYVGPGKEGVKKEEGGFYPSIAARAAFHCARERLCD